MTCEKHCLEPRPRGGPCKIAGESDREESGALDKMLEKAATHYENAVDDSVNHLTSLLEPIIMSVLGVLVGGLLIAKYLPIFQLGNVV